MTRRYIDPHFREVAMHDTLSFVVDFSKLNVLSAT